MMNLEQWFYKLCGTKGSNLPTLLLRITFTDGMNLTGTFFGFTCALDNDPEIASVDFVRNDNGVLTEALETEIAKIEVLNCPELSCAVFEAIDCENTTLKRPCMAEGQTVQ